MSSLALSHRSSTHLDCPILLGGCLPIFVASLACRPPIRARSVPCLPRSTSLGDSSSSFSSPNLPPANHLRATTTATSGNICTCWNRHLYPPPHICPPRTDQNQPAPERPTSRLSDIYDRMFPPSAPLTHSPRWLSPIETVDIVQPSLIGTGSRSSSQEPAIIRRSSSSPSISTASLSLPLSTHSTDDIALSSMHLSADALMTPPIAHDGSPTEARSLGPPFSPDSIPLPQSPMSTSSSPISSPALGTPATQSSILVHTPATPLYSTARVVYSSPHKAPITPQQSVYTFPIVPGSTVSPRAFSISTCNDWIHRLSPPNTPSGWRTRMESSTTIASFVAGIGTESQISVPSAPLSPASTPRDSYELKKHQDRLQALSEWNTLMDAQISERKLSPTTDDDMNEENSNLADDENVDDSIMTIPELRLPDWTLDIPEDFDDLDSFIAHTPELEQDVPLPLRGILRPSHSDSTSDKTSAHTTRSVTWAPEESLRQMKYISVDGSVLGLDSEGYPRPLTPEEERRQAEYERVRQWI